MREKKFQTLKNKQVVKYLDTMSNNERQAILPKYLKEKIYVYKYFILKWFIYNTCFKVIYRVSKK